MKTTEEIEVKPIAAHKKTITVYSCDFCNYKTQNTPGGGLGQTVISCKLCNRHVCRRRDNACGRSDPFEWGDYPDYYCPPCYRLRVDGYNHVYEEMEKEYDRKVEALDKKIITESLQLKA